MPNAWLPQSPGAQNAPFQGPVQTGPQSPFASAQLPGPINIAALYGQQQANIGTGQYSGDTFNQFSPELLNAISLMSLQNNPNFGPGSTGPQGGQRDPGMTQGQGNQEGWNPTGFNPPQYGPDGNLMTRDNQRLNELNYFQDWWNRNPSGQNPNGSQSALPDWLQQQQQGTYSQYQRGEWAPWIGNAIGTGLGAFAGVPGVGELGKRLGQAYTSNLYDNYFFQSTGTDGGIYDNWQGDGPNPGPVPRDDPMAEFWDSVNAQDPRTWGALNSPVGPERSVRGPNGNWTNPGNSQFINDWNNRYGNTHNSNFDQSGNRIGRSGNMFGDLPAGLDFKGGRPVGADGRSAGAGDLWVTFTYGD